MRLSSVLRFICSSNRRQSSCSVMLAVFPAQRSIQQPVVQCSRKSLSSVCILPCVLPLSFALLSQESLVDVPGLVEHANFVALPDCQIGVPVPGGEVSAMLIQSSVCLSRLCFEFLYAQNLLCVRIERHD